MANAMIGRLGAVAQPCGRPERRHAEREHHRLADQPQHADVVAPEARDDLAHQQGTNHPPLDREASS